MFAAVLSSGYAGEMIVYGPFASKATAKSWIAGRQNPLAYLCAACWSLPPPPTDGALTPTAFSVGEYMVASMLPDFAGRLQIFLYGVFADPAEADSWVADQPAPEVYQVVVCEAVS